MKNILFISLILIFLFGCGKKSSPEYQGYKIENKTIIYL